MRFVLYFNLSSVISHPIALALFHFRGKRVPPCENVTIKNRLSFKIFKDFHQKRSQKQNLYFDNSANLCLWPSFYCQLLIYREQWCSMYQKVECCSWDASVFHLVNPELSKMRCIKMKFNKLQSLIISLCSLVNKYRVFSSYIAGLCSNQ